MSPHPPPTPSAWHGRLCVLAAVLLWSSSGLFAKSAVFADWPLEQRGLLLAFWRAAFAALCLAPLVRRPRWRGTLVPMTAAFTVMNVCYLSAMTFSTAANAIWLQNTAPMWVSLLGVLFLQDPPSRRDIPPLIFAAAGVAVILWFEAQGQAVRGIVLGLVSGFSYACVVVCLRLLRTENAVWLIAVNHAVAALCMLPWVLYLDRWPSGTQWLVLAAFGAVQMAAPYVLFARSLRSISSHEATGLGLLEPLLTPLWVFLLGMETPAPWTLAGGGLILAGLAWRYLRTAPPHPSALIEH